MLSTARFSTAPGRSFRPTAALRALVIAGAACGLTGCFGASTGGGVTAPAPAPAQPPPTDMAGRWTLSAASGGSCAMNFAAAQGAEGAIRPEGGCPGNFYTSRKWTYEDSSLVIRDHNSAPLGRLRLAAPGRFEGQSSAGQPVTLVR